MVVSDDEDALCSEYGGEEVIPILPPAEKLLKG